jgi:thymidylate synthase (FAD)
MKIDVLDHGFVELIGTMISESTDKNCAQTLDEMVVEAARVSYGGGLKGPEKDRKLLHYLIEHEHGTPLEAAVFKFEVKCPMFVMRQWVRHRWGSFNEISGRYTEQIAEQYYVPKIFRAQDTKNRQGSTNEDRGYVLVYPFHAHMQDSQLPIREVYEQFMEQTKAMYQMLIDCGVAKEIARSVLGTGFYTQFVWTVNARSLMNFLILRCEKHAQWEIREYAWTLYKIFEEKMPWTHASLATLFRSSFEN